MSAPPRKRGLGPRGAGRLATDPTFDVTPYVLETRLMPRTALKLDNARSGNPRAPVQDWINKLQEDYLSNPPTEVSVTTWCDPGIVRVSVLLKVDVPVTLSA